MVVGISEDGCDIDRYVVVEAEAALVRRIYELYAAGYSLKAICDILDNERVPTPSAKWRRRNKVGKWNRSSLSGNFERGEGILNNRAYIGERSRAAHRRPNAVGRGQGASHRVACGA